MVPLSAPYKLVLLVPKPNQVTRDQLFGSVFSLNAFIFITIIILVVETSLFCNPLYLTCKTTVSAMHGSPPEPLDQAKPWVALLLSSFSLFMSIAASAYMPHLLALTMQRPFQPTVQTFDQLLASDMKIFANLQQFPDLREDPIFNPRINHWEHGHYHFDGRHAYLLDAKEAEFWQSMSINFKRYRQLDWSIMGNVRFHYVYMRHLVLPSLIRYERRCFESGLWNQWNRENERAMDGEITRRFGKGEVDGGMRAVDDRALSIGDLRFCWWLFGVGLCAGFFVFLMEVLLYWCN